MLPNILLFLLFFLHSHARRISDEQRWHIKYMSNTNRGEFDRVITGYGFDTESLEEEIPFNVCEKMNIVNGVRLLANLSGYVYCTNPNKGIKQMCSPGTEASYKIPGCVNKTTNTPVLPIGSRCASQPCQNGGTCIDFSSIDGYFCQCSFPYQGLHCHLLRKKSCAISLSQCGARIGKKIPWCKPFTNDMALDYVCHCIEQDRPYEDTPFAANNCDTDELFVPKCEGKPPVGALPFTNKGFYFCPWNMTTPVIESCPLHHVWNDTQKECVLENS